MKNKLISLGMCFVLLLSFLAIGVTEGEGDGDLELPVEETEEGDLELPVEDQLEEVLVEETEEPSGSSSFVLSKGNEILGLTSSYDGIGWGTALPKTIWYDITLRNYLGNFREITILAKPNQTFESGFSTIHFKEINKPLEYKNYEVFDSFEIIGSLSDQDVLGYRVVIRITKEVDPEKVEFIFEDGKESEQYFTGKRIKEDLEDYYFELTLPGLGLLTSAIKEPIKLTAENVVQSGGGPCYEDKCEVDY